MRINFKFFILLTSTLFLFIAALPSNLLASKTEHATTLVNSLLNKVNNIQKLTDNEEKKQAEFLDLIQTYFDMDVIAKVSTGPYWRIATLNEKERYTKLITELIADVTASNLGNMTNFEFEFKASIPKGEKMVMVSGNLLIPDQSISSIAIKWRISFLNEEVPKIIDIEFENISMLVTQKEENLAIIRKNGGVFSALINEMENKLTK